MQVVKIVGLRKILDFCSCVFSPEELFWLDNLMPLGRKTEQMETEVVKVNVKYHLLKISLLQELENLDKHEITEEIL